MGAVIIIQGNSIFSQFGQSELLYSVLIIVITRELGPILTAFIIIARSGTAIATELGGMVVSHQVEAYVSIGINPISYLVVPRFLGMVIGMMILNIYFNFIGLFGAFFVSQLFNTIPFQVYFKNILAALQFSDIMSSLTKSFLFGTIISTVATYQGFNVKVSSTEIPQVVIKAVGQGIVLCLVADVIMMLMLRI
jgi:phospholipid/cholesterol/gamma-HCH transport system permease protein